MRKILSLVVLLMVVLVPGIGGAAEEGPDKNQEKFTLLSPTFKDGQSMPARYKAKQENKSPALQWLNPPPGTVKFAITCKDYDPPANGYVHWDIRNIPASYSELPEGIPPKQKWQDGIIQATPWEGPYPPNGVHKYHFVIEAKDASGKTIGKASLIGLSSD